jgi:hypothetical protein
MQIDRQKSSHQTMEITSFSLGRTPQWFNLSKELASAGDDLLLKSGKTSVLCGS